MHKEYHAPHIAVNLSTPIKPPSSNNSNPSSPSSPSDCKVAGSKGSQGSKKKMSKAECKAEAKKKKVFRTMSRNIWPLVMSALLSITFACVGTYLLIYIFPWMFNAFQKGVLQTLQWYKGSELKASDIVEERTLKVRSDLSLTSFKDSFLHQSPVLYVSHALPKAQHHHLLKALFTAGQSPQQEYGDMDLHVMSPGSAQAKGEYTTTLRKFIESASASAGAGADADVHASTQCIEDKDEDDERGKSDVEYCKITTPPPAAEYVEGAEALLRSMGIDSSSLLSRSSSSSSSKKQASTALANVPDLGGPLRLSITRANRGPPFRQGVQLWTEVMYGQVQWVLFHPQSLPAIGYSVNESLSQWMDSVYPHISSRDAPVLVMQRPGEVLYVPEGWFYAYRADADSPVAAMLVQEAKLTQLGSLYNFLVEGRRRLELGDATGAKEILQSAVDKSKTGGSFLSYFSGLTQIMGRTTVMDNPTGNGRGRIPFTLLLELGTVLNAQGETEAEEVAYRDAISFNSRYAKLYELYVSAVIRGAEETALIERSKVKRLSTKDSKGKVKNKGMPGCSETAVKAIFEEARKKLGAAIALARASSAVTFTLEELELKAMSLFAPQTQASGAQLYCGVGNREYLL